MYYNWNKNLYLQDIVKLLVFFFSNKNKFFFIKSKPGEHKFCFRIELSQIDTGVGVE